VLVVAFRTPGKHHYRVVRKNSNDVTLEVTKDLRFEGKRGDPSKFNGLSIFLPS
jgi:hypothetical protein